jgi:hypothetical protein
MRRTFEELDADSPAALGAEPSSRHHEGVRHVVLASLIAACTTGGPRPPAGFAHRHAPTTATLTGLARDHDSGDPVAHAEIHLRGGGVDNLRAVTNDKGVYTVPELEPGSYQLTAEFAGQQIDVTAIDLKAGEATHVDLVFTLGHPDPVHIQYGDPKMSAIDRYRPTHISSQASIIEGTVNDVGTKERVAGAVVTVTNPSHNETTEQTVTDDDGRYRFDVSPGTYDVSAYYSVGGHGQIEVRRGDIAVAGAEAVIVPLWVELTK